jgi:hypothetical protein
LRRHFKLAEWSRQISMIDSLALVERNVRRDAQSDDGERLGPAFAQRAGSASTPTIEPLATASRGSSFDCISPAYDPKFRAPGNRKIPRQALASVSQYVLPDFLRDFPDDEACLQWLWRQRYLPGRHARPL